MACSATRCKFFTLSRPTLTQRRYQLKDFSTLEKQSGDNQDPLYRLFYREGSIGHKLLSQVRRDLTDVVKVCDGELKQTNHLRTLMSSLTKGMLHLSGCDLYSVFIS